MAFVPQRWGQLARGLLDRCPQTVLQRQEPVEQLNPYHCVVLVPAIQRSSSTFLPASWAQSENYRTDRLRQAFASFWLLPPRSGHLHLLVHAIAQSRGWNHGPSLLPPRNTSWRDLWRAASALYLHISCDIQQRSSGWLAWWQTAAVNFLTILVAILRENKTLKRRDSAQKLRINAEKCHRIILIIILIDGPTFIHKSQKFLSQQNSASWKTQKNEKNLSYLSRTVFTLFASTTKDNEKGSGCLLWGSNSRPPDYETDALPTELRRHLKISKIFSV